MRAPALHQPDRGDDDDADGERKQSAPFARGRKTEGQTRQREGAKRLRLAEALKKGGGAEQAEGQRENIQHRGSRLDEQHLVEKGDQRRRDRGPLRGKQREPAEIDRDDRERAEQRGGIAPAQRIVAERGIENAMICLASGGCIGLSIGSGMTGSSICRAAGT